LKPIDPARHVSLEHLGRALFCLAVLVRIVHLLHVGPTSILSYHRTFPDSDMYLFDQWARRIAAGDVLGRETYHPVLQWQLQAAPLADWSRWYGDSPVYYRAPFYAYLVGALYAVFGDPIPALPLLQILASSVCVLLLLRIGIRLFGPTPAFLGALLYALYAPAIHYDAIMLRGPWITFVALLGTLQLIGLLDHPTLLRALTTGLTLGATLVVNEGFLIVPALALLLLTCRMATNRRTVVCAATLSLGIALSLAPVAIRNVLVGVSPLKLAVTGSTVYAVFNSAGSNPYFFEAEPSTFVPTLRAGEGRLLATALACVKSFAGPAEVGLFYLKKASGLAIPFENPDNANFYYAALKDPLLRLLPNYSLLLPLSVIGFILALKQWRDWLPLIPFSLSLLLSVMVALPLSRYRTTFAVFLTPFAGLALARVVCWIKERRVVHLTLSGAAFVLMLAGAAAWQARAVFGGRPAGMFTHRALEFFVEADYDARQGRHAEAIGEMLLLLRLNPDRSVRAGAMLKLAALQRANGQEAAARETIETAVESNPQDPMLLMAAGDFHLGTLHDAMRARAFYERALLLRPPGGLDRALRMRLASLEAVESAAVVVSPKGLR